MASGGWSCSRSRFCSSARKSPRSPRRAASPTCAGRCPRRSPPAVTWLATAGQGDDRYAGLPSVYTIHNLMHQGTAPWNVLNYLGVHTQNLAEERRGEVNFMARGIFHATMITTVSPTYAREIMGREGGGRLDGLPPH